MSMINDAMSASMPGSAKQFFAGVQTKPIGSMAIYVAILSLFGFVGTVVGLSVIGISMGILGSFKLSFEYSILLGALSLVTTVIALIGASMIFAAMSQNFVGRQVSAAEMATIAGYAMTPALVLGILAIIPALGSIGMLIGGIYSLYLLYLGCGAKFGADKAIISVVGYVVAAIVIGVVLGVITNVIIMSMFNPYAAFGAVTFGY